MLSFFSDSTGSSLISFIFQSTTTKWHFISRFWLNEVRNLSAKGPLKCTTTWTWLYVPFQSLIKGVTYSSLVTVMIARDYNWKLDILVTWKSFSGYSIFLSIRSRARVKKVYQHSISIWVLRCKMHFGLVPQLDTFFVLNSTVRRRPMLSLLDSPLLLTCVNLVHFDQAFITGENVFFATSKSHSIFAAGLCTARCMSLSARSKDERRKWTMRYYKGLLQLIYQHIKSDGFFGPRRPIAIWNFTHNMSPFPRASALTKRADHIYWK